MKILVVEDDTNLRQGLKILLELEKYRVITANDGKRGLNAFYENLPDFCIFDIMLPELDGYALCKKLREDGFNTPILMLSAKGEEIDKIIGFEQGADDYLVKPFSTSELLARIKAISNRASLSKTNSVNPIGENHFYMRDLKILPETYCAYRQSHQIALTVREIKILTLLYAEQGKPVSRDRIYNHCWGHQYFPNSRALDQYITGLRQKIEKNPGRPKIIETVRGIGYRFNPVQN